MLWFFVWIGVYQSTITRPPPHLKKCEKNYTLSSLAKVNVLLLDDYGLATLEDRHGLQSTLVTSQLPVEHWHETIGDATLADAILDRLIHNAHRINLKGESMRKTKSSLTAKSTTE